ncbi:hypothetical protein L6164_027963 [Bauhinia variegata]|uniref:Uncharacterized protein n=1 Tax=Bauhinia variegata TaxID=167791 RepID=A0ACB9LVN5_BAUVA|nr:hypothetical protein L6164_027963 [Bauhinia variegata]
MEKLKKDQKLPSGRNQESETNKQLNKQDQAITDVELGTSNKTSSPSPSHDNAPPPNQQTPPIVQWSYTPRTATEELHQVSIPTQAPSPCVLNQWQQLPHPQHSFMNQVQQGQAFLPSLSPFWQPHQPSGPMLGPNVPTTFQTFTPFGTNGASCQAQPFIAGGTSSRGQPMVPNICYHVGHTFPGFPGPWDPSSWLGQIYQSQSPYAYSFPGPLSYTSATPGMHGCLPSVEHSFQRGIIRPPAKLSQKHQQLWEAQSAENVQLWSVINNMQSEVADYKDRVMKLAEEVSSLKQKLEESSGEVIVAGTGQAPKKGRPKRSIASIDALHESQPPRGRGRKPAISKTHSEIKSPIFEKVILRKVENKEKSYHSSATTAVEQENNEKLSGVVTGISSNIGISQSNSMLSTYQGIQICQTALNSASEAKGNFGKDKDMKIAYSELSLPSKVLNSNNMDISANNIGSTGNGSLGWPSDITCQDSARNVLDIDRQGFFHNGSFIKQDGKMTPGWCFTNEEDASEELEGAVVGSSKEENEEEMGDDSSSGAEEIGGTKDEDACTMNDVIAASPKDLPPLYNW